MTEEPSELKAPVANLALLSAAGIAFVVAVALQRLPAMGGRGIAVGAVAVALLLAAGISFWKSFQRVRDTIDHLRQRESRQQAIISGAGDAIVVIDDQATILTFNRAAERMFGYSAGEVIGTSLERLMTEGGRRAHAAYLAEHGVTAMVEAARLRAVHKGLRKRGDVFPFELTMTEWLDEGRRMFTGVMRDVTDQERAADALRESHARFVGIFETAAQPLFIFSLSGGGDFVLETMNEAAEAFVGVSRYAAVGRTPDDFMQADARDLKRALLDCLATGSLVSNTFRVPAHGADCPLDVVFTPMRNASGEIHAVLATGHLPMTFQLQTTQSPDAQRVCA